jgi:hypothetical protein
MGKPLFKETTVISTKTLIPVQKRSQNDQTNSNTEFLQPYAVVAADVLLEIGTVVI